MADIIQIRRDTAANWVSANPVLAQGELGVETDTLKIKVGNGTTNWTSLGYLIDTNGYLVKANNLSDLTNATTARSNLGLGTAATATVTTSATDTTANRLLKVGDFGVGSPFSASASLRLPLLFDFTETDYPSGFYRSASNAPSSPTGEGNDFVINATGAFGARAAQLYLDATSAASQKLYFRKYDPTALEWRPWRELYHTGNLEITQTPTDTTAGRLTKVGDFGVGAGLDISNADLDAAINGFFGNNGNSAPPLEQPDGDTGTGRWAWITIGVLNAKMQLAQRANRSPRDLYVRSEDSGNWRPWRKVYDTGNILGTVVQPGTIVTSGANNVNVSTVTGAIIERGSNSNGEYVRFADGTQICTMVDNLGEASIGSSSLNDLWRTPSINPRAFPKEFVAPPTVSITATRDVGGGPARGCGAQCRFAATSNMNSLQGWAFQPASAVLIANSVAHGRWY